jgi:hypothetical protein
MSPGDTQRDRVGRSLISFHQKREGEFFAFPRPVDEFAVTRLFRCC